MVSWNLDEWFNLQSKKLDEEEKTTGIDTITGKKINEEKRKAWAKVMRK
tara:strand:- start:171 stop:317 length:147 start_codon:yes stop_codon:yes gene_type:complete